MGASTRAARPVEGYLKSRALELTDDLANTVLRFHPQCFWRDENTGKTIKVPAMLACFRSIHDDTITGIHRIRVDQGPKPDRRMLGIIGGAAVKLDSIAGGTKLHVGEGVETCMAARQMGLKPAWALGGVSAISFFPIITGIKHLIILGETGSASYEAQKICARRWQRAFRRVEVAMPEEGMGDDLNDALMLSTSQ